MYFSCMLLDCTLLDFMTRRSACETRKPETENQSGDVRVIYNAVLYVYGFACLNLRALYEGTVHKRHSTHSQMTIPTEKLYTNMWHEYDEHGVLFIVSHFRSVTTAWFNEVPYGFPGFRVCTFVNCTVPVLILQYDTGLYTITIVSNVSFCSICAFFNTEQIRGPIVFRKIFWVYSRQTYTI